MSRNQKIPDVIVLIDEDMGVLTDYQKYLVAEFCCYKKISISESVENYVAPNEGVQAKKPSLHNLFGRDRVFDFPHKLLGHIVDENVAHVHVDTTEKLWSKNNSSVGMHQQ